MPIQVKKMAEVVDRQVMLCPSSKKLTGEFLDRVVTLTAVPNADQRAGWKLNLKIEEKGKHPRQVELDLPSFLTESDYTKSLTEPVLLQGGALLYFRNRLLMPERAPVTYPELEEVALRAKKIVYDKETELSGLKAQVANVEAALEFARQGAKRAPISDDVKLLVWARDGGACVRCGAKTALHFDHVIPVAKGGGNSAENIQILCAKCNLRKSDKIAGDA